MIRIQITIPGGSTDTFGATATITVVGDYNGGTCIDGSKYIIAPAGVKVTGSSPAPATVDGRDGNGIQADPQQDYTPTQALDAGIAGYSAGAALDSSVIYRPGSAILKVESTNPRVNSGRAGLFERSTVLHVVASRPPANAMAPAIWPSADLAIKPWRVADVDGLLAGLPSYAATGAPTWASLAAYWDKLDFGLALSRGYYYQYLTPEYISGTNTAYGEDRANLQSTIWAGICSDQWSAADKTAAVIRALSNGCQIAESYGAFGVNIGQHGDGAHYQWYLADCLAWLKATGRTGQYATLMPIIGGNVRGQYHQVTAGMYDPHDSAVLPYIARRRTVSAITGSGPYQVTVTGYVPGSGLTEDTASNAVFTGLNMIRESNSSTALITAQSVSSGSWVLTVANLPSGLAVSDAIYCGEVSPLPVGAWDWTLRNRTAYPNLPNPSPSAEYRSNNKHGHTVCVASILGMRGSDLDGAKGYLERVSSATSYGQLEAGVLGSINTFARDFWTTHQSTILALPQDV